MDNSNILSTRRLGYKGYLPDHRDEPYLFRNALQKLEGVSDGDVPAELLVKNMNKQPVIDQGMLGSCVGCSVSTLHAHVRKVVPRSSLQAYWNSRLYINETHLDQGAYIRHGVQGISEYGLGRSSWWPYEEENVFVDPPLKVDMDALKRRIFSYHRLETGEDYRACLAAGFPFVIGFMVYSNFMSAHTARTGICGYPAPGENPEGGHAVLCFGRHDNFRESQWAQNIRTMGYPDSYIPERVYIFRNSWSIKWGSAGNFAMDARAVENPNIFWDGWTIRKVRDPASGLIT